MTDRTEDLENAVIGLVNILENLANYVSSKYRMDVSKVLYDLEQVKQEVRK